MLTPANVEVSPGPNIPIGAVTGVGSFPGADVWEAVAIVAGEMPDFPILPELPDRGPGADMIGRTMSLVADISSDFAVSTTATGWRISGGSRARASSQMRRAGSWIGEDLDAVESRFADYRGPFKVALVGPWTLAATVELASGERLLRDLGAVAELQTVLAEASAQFVRALSRRLPSAQIFVQFDEPALPAVLAGDIPTQSGFAAYQPVEAPMAIRGLQAAAVSTQQIAAIGFHCCADRVPLRLLRAVKPDFLSLDLLAMAGLGAAARDQADEQIGELFDDGGLLIGGILGIDGAGGARSGRSQVQTTSRPVNELLHRLGISVGELDSQLALSSSCGLAGCGTLERAREVLTRLDKAARVLRDDQVGSDS